MDSDEVGVTKAAPQLLLEIDAALAIILKEKPDRSRENAEFARFERCMDRFQPSPQLLDSRLREFVDRTASAYRDHYLHSEKDGWLVSKVFYQFAKVRGTKTISSCLSSDISLISAVFDKIATVSHWETRFFLLVWLSILALVPFPLDRIRVTLSDDIYGFSMKYLSKSGKETDAASVLMARFLSRADTTDYLDSFITANFNTITWGNDTVYVKIGLLSTVNGLLKLTTLPHISHNLDRILTLITNELQDTVAPSLLKLFVKILGKISLFFMRIYQYRRVEEIITNLLCYVSHPDTLIRYSVAKQLAKIGRHLDQSSRYDILGALYEMLQLDDFDSATIDITLYHGVLLSFGEFCRLKLVNQTWIHRIAQIVHRTLFIEQQRATHIVGANVRDASCFCCWSLFKRYRTEELPPVLVDLFQDLLLVCCFDGDLMIRRASSATIQELIGRHGDSVLVDSGCDIFRIDQLKVKLIETLDYTTLGHTDKSYELATEISLLGLNHDRFIDFLFNSGIHNQDSQLCKLSATTLRMLVSDPEPLVTALLQETRTGTLYAIGELISEGTQTDEFHQLLSSFEFDFHRDRSFKGVEYLHLLTNLARWRSFKLNNTELDNVFHIVRADDPAITEEFVTLSKYMGRLPDQYQEKWIHYIQYGNRNCAAALGYSSILETRPNAIESITDRKIDAELRGMLIQSVSYYLLHSSKDIPVTTLIAGLDDYTVTNKGDVGSLVRLATIRLIRDNAGRFESDSIRGKLLRLSCEIINTVRDEAFKLISDSVPNNYDEYFDTVLSIYLESYNEDVSKEFWRGYSFAGGSVQASDDIVNAALRSFFRMWEKPNTPHLRILSDLFSLLRKQECNDTQRMFKIQTACLGFTCNLLELNLDIPAEFKLESVFVRTYNLTLGSSNYERLDRAIRIFTNLYLRDPSRFTGCFKRLQWLSKNQPTTVVKARAHQALQEIEFE